MLAAPILKVTREEAMKYSCKKMRETRKKGGEEEEKEKRGGRRRSREERTKTK